MTANRARLQVMQGCAGTVTAINAEHPIPGQLVHRASQLIDALLLQEHCQAILQRLTNTRCRSAIASSKSSGRSFESLPAGLLCALGDAFYAHAVQFRHFEAVHLLWRPLPVELHSLRRLCLLPAMFVTLALGCAGRGHLQARWQRKDCKRCAGASAGWAGWPALSGRGWQPHHQNSPLPVLPPALWQPHSFSSCFYCGTAGPFSLSNIKDRGSAGAGLCNLLLALTCGLVSSARGMKLLPW